MLANLFIYLYTKKAMKKKYLEIEFKYLVDGSQVFAFKNFMNKQFEGKFSFEYIESDDDYFFRDINDPEFLRFRYGKKGDYKELTHKKRIDPETTTVREETNVALALDQDDEDVINLCENLGFKHNFKISKMVHLYRFEDATIPFYTVVDMDGGIEHFIEIEADEDLTNKIGEKKSLKLIEKYEKIIAEGTGLISKEKRITTSLADRYKRNKKGKRVFLL